MLPVTDEQLPVAQTLLEQMLDADLRAELAAPDRGTLSARKRNHHRVPYLAVIGAREASDKLVSLRLRDRTQLDPLAAPQAIERVTTTISTRSHEL